MVSQTPTEGAGTEQFPFKTWCERALEALLTLWDPATHSAWRDSRAIAVAAASAAPKPLFPTATFHSVIALEECGILRASALYRDGVLRVSDSDLSIRTQVKPPSSQDILNALLSRGGNPTPAHPDEGWVPTILTQSSNAESAGPRQTIVLTHLIQAIRGLASSAGPHESSKVATGLGDAIERLIRGFRLANKNLPTDHDLFSDYRFSPYICFMAALGLAEAAIAWQRLGNDSANLPHGADARALSSTLDAFFSRLLDYHLARSRIPLDRLFDNTALSFGLAGLTLSQQTPLDDGPLIHACVEGIVRAQTEDGCWPGGASVTYSQSGDIVQQPSVAIALLLVQSVLTKDALTTLPHEREGLLRAVLPALESCGRYLASSFNRASARTNNVAGWSSDRVRWPGLSETWITAMAARFFFNAWLCQVSVQRAAILRRYETIWPKGQGPPPTKQQWLADVVEPEQITRPCETVFDAIIEPICRQTGIFRRPADNGVSLILYGPPGSGKTYFVKQIAAALRWPLVMLNPGPFIEAGLEMIESRASSIFRGLMELHHSVVFFDECDELFRERDESQEAGRNILSFATASMLPKLQDLHDTRRVIFVLGTNYLSRVDTAIRRPGRFDLVLLLDRPDELARERLLEKYLTPATKSDINTTAGWMVKEVSEYAKGKASHAPGRAATPPDISDYVDWLANRAQSEIDASRLNKNDKDALIACWAKVPGVLSVRRRK